jgi:hypothetical protein
MAYFIKSTKRLNELKIKQQKQKNKNYPYLSYNRKSILYYIIFLKFELFQSKIIND